LPFQRIGRDQVKCVAGAREAAMTRIVTYAHRPKRPPRRLKAQAAIIGPAVVTSASRRRSKAAPDTDAAEVSPEVQAFFARMVRPGGALPPKR
jgi:hypothetical protein